MENQYSQLSLSPSLCQTRTPSGSPDLNEVKWLLSQWWFSLLNTLPLFSAARRTETRELTDSDHTYSYTFRQNSPDPQTPRDNAWWAGVSTSSVHRTRGKKFPRKREPALFTPSLGNTGPGGGRGDGSHFPLIYILPTFSLVLVLPISVIGCMTL